MSGIGKDKGNESVESGSIRRVHSKRHCFTCQQMIHSLAVGVT